MALLIVLINFTLYSSISLITLLARVNSQPLIRVKGIAASKPNAVVPIAFLIPSVRAVCCAAPVKPDKLANASSKPQMVPKSPR